MELISVHRSLLISLFALLSLFDLDMVYLGYLDMVYLGYLDMVYLGTVNWLPLVVAFQNSVTSTFFLCFLRQVTQKAKFCKVNQRISYLFYFLDGV